jgi:hypothetical protein
MTEQALPPFDFEAYKRQWPGSPETEAEAAAEVERLAYERLQQDRVAREPEEPPQNFLEGSGASTAAEKLAQDCIDTVLLHIQPGDTQTLLGVAQVFATLALVRVTREHTEAINRPSVKYVLDRETGRLKEA